MVALTHTVFIDAVPQSWFEGVVAVLAGLAEESRAVDGLVRLPGGRTVPDVRLVEGRHLRSGAVYAVEDEDSDVRVTVKEWNRRRVLRAGLVVEAPDATLRLDGALRRVDRPRELEASGRMRVAGVWPMLSRFEGVGRLRLDEWWAAAGSGRDVRSAPLRARLDHRLFRTELRAVPGMSEDDGRLAVRVTLTVRGRHLLRPVAAVVLSAVERPLRRSVVRALDSMAAEWNERAAEILAQDPAGLRKAILEGP